MPFVFLESERSIFTILGRVGRRGGAEVPGLAEGDSEAEGQQGRVERAAGRDHVQGEAKGRGPRARGPARQLGGHQGERIPEKVHRNDEVSAFSIFAGMFLFCRKNYFPIFFLRPQ